MSVKKQTIMANSIDPDETAHYDPSHQGLHSLHRYLVWPEGLKGLRGKLYTFRGENPVKNAFASFLFKGSTLKGKNLLPVGVLIVTTVLQY